MPSLQQQLVRQFRQPTGALGHLAGWIMSTRGSNRARNHWTVAQLGIDPGDRVLEIGFGPGLAIERAAAPDSGAAHVVGVDHSEVMLRVATRRNRRAIAAGRVTLHLGSAAHLPRLDGPFDRIFTVNCLMFWPDPAASLDALRELLRPGGLLAVTHQSRKPGATLADVADAEVEIARQLVDAGLAVARTERLELPPVPASCILAHRSPAPA